MAPLAYLQFYISKSHLRIMGKGTPADQTNLIQRQNVHLLEERMKFNTVGRGKKRKGNGWEVPGGTKAVLPAQIIPGTTLSAPKLGEIQSTSITIHLEPFLPTAHPTNGNLAFPLAGLQLLC